MTTKKKSSLTVMSAMLSASTILSPIAVQGQEDTTNKDLIPNEQTAVQRDKTQAPAIVIPQQLTGEEGMPLHSIALPENWSWVSKDTILSKEVTQYPARYIVDDEAYDYTSIKGYHAQGHYVEYLLELEVKEEQPVIEQAPLVQVSTVEQKVEPMPMAQNGDIIIDATSFPDAAFREYILSEDYGEDGILTQKEIANITSIDVSYNSNITDLTGIGYFTALEIFYCNDTSITKLDLSKNLALTFLDCSNTKIISLDVSYHKNLTTLYCYNMEITDLNLSNNKALEILNCSETKIANLNLSSNTELDVLDCSYTLIANLDFSSNTALTILRCNNTKIASLDVSNLTILSTLDCSDNAELKNLKVEGAVELWELMCSETKITSLDVSKLTILSILDCSKNPELKTLHVEGAEAITYLNCEKTGISSLDVSGNTSINYLNCTDAPLTYLNIGDNTELNVVNTNTSFSMYAAPGTFKIQNRFKGIDPSKVVEMQGADYNPETGEVSNYTAGKPISYTYKCGTSNNGEQTIRVTLNLTDHLELNEINIPDEKFRAWLKSQHYGQSGVISQADIQSITTIDFDGKINVKDLTGISYFTNLTVLNCTGTGITSINLSENTKLERLDLFSTNISSLDISKNRALKFLDCSNTEIESLDVSNNGNLGDLFCDGTKITSLDVSNNGNLQYLSCDGTNITSLDVSNNGNLQFLSCFGTPLAYLNIGTNDKLEVQIDNNYTSTIKVAEDSFNIVDKFPGINLGNIKDVKAIGADYKDGVIRMYDKDASISYTYICGSAKQGVEQRLSVTLSIRDSRADSTISIQDKLDKTYDGKAVKDKPAVDQTGSSGTVTYKWEHLIGNAWQEINSAPSEAGTYRVTATVASNNNYRGQTSQAVEFTIAQAESTISIQDKLDKTYDGKAVKDTPAVDQTGSSGTVTYKWEHLIGNAWQEINSAPSEAGTYRVTATVASNNNYRGQTSQAVEFTIAQAESTISIQDKLDKTYDGKAVKDTPAVDQTGSSGTVTYKWEHQVGNTWEKINSAPSEAGTYRVTATVASNNNYKGQTSQAVEFTIAQAESTLSIKGSLDKEYDGKEVDARSNTEHFGSRGAITYKWEYKNNGIWENINTAPSEAGTYRVTASLASDNNYKGQTSQAKEFTIAKAESTLSIKGSLDKKYDGNKVDARSNTDHFGSRGTITYKWEYKNNSIWENINTAPSEAGTYRVTASLAPDNNYKGQTSQAVEFTIAQAESTIQIEEVLDKAYDGNTVHASPKVAITGSDSTVLYKWERKGSGEQWDMIPSAPSERGTYRVSAIVAANRNFKGAVSVPMVFEITQGMSKISITDTLDKVFDGKPVKDQPSVDIFGSRGAITYKWERQINDVWKEMDTAPSGIGIYRVSASVAGDVNYQGATSEPKVFHISMKSSTISITAALDKVYDGKPVMDTPTVATSGSEGEVRYQWERKTAKEEWDMIPSAPTNAGIYRVRATLAPKGDFAGASSLPVVFTITQQDSFISIVEDLQKTYDGVAVNASPDVDKTGSSGAIRYQWERQEQDGNWKKISFVPRDAGVYRVIASIAADENYKSAASIAKVFTIKQASNSLIEDLVMKGWTYGGMAAQPFAFARFGEVRFTYSDSKHGKYTTTMPTTAGTWYVKASVAGTQNFTGIEVIQAFSISLRDVQTDTNIQIPEIIEDEDVNTLVIKDGDKALVKGEDYDVEVRQAGNKAIVTVTFKGNYTGTITKAYAIKKEEKEEVIKETGYEKATGFYAIWSMLITGCAGLCMKKRKGQKHKS